MSEFISIRQSEYHELLTRVGELEGTFPEIELAKFKEAFENESGYELERKRGVYRAWIVQKRAIPDTEQRLQILTDIIKDRGERRAAFEQRKETSANIRQSFQVLGNLVCVVLGVLLGYVLGKIG